MVDFPTQNPISQGFGNNKLNILVGNVKLFGNILQGYLGVCQIYLPEPDSDDNLIEPENELVEFVPSKSRLILFYNFVEVIQASF